MDVKEAAEKAAEVEVLEHCKVLELKPGDVVVFRPAQRLSDHDVAAAAAALRRLFPANPSVVLGPNDELSAVRSPSPEQKRADEVNRYASRLILPD